MQISTRLAKFDSYFVHTDVPTRSDFSSFQFCEILLKCWYSNGSVSRPVRYTLVPLCSVSFVSHIADHVRSRVDTQNSVFRSPGSDHSYRVKIAVLKLLD